MGKKRQPSRTVEYLDELKRRYGLPSDYKVAALLGISTAAVAQYRTKGNTFKDEVALKVAELLELPPGKVLADMQAERAKDARVRDAWRQIAARMADAAAFAGVAILATVFGVVFSLMPAKAEAGQWVAPLPAQAAQPITVDYVKYHRPVGVSGRQGRPVWREALHAVRRLLPSPAPLPRGRDRAAGPLRGGSSAPACVRAGGGRGHLAAAGALA